MFCYFNWKILSHVLHVLRLGILIIRKQNFIVLAPGWVLFPFSSKIVYSHLKLLCFHLVLHQVRMFVVRKKLFFGVWAVLSYVYWKFAWNQVTGNWPSKKLLSKNSHSSLSPQSPKLNSLQCLHSLHSQSCHEKFKKHYIN